MPLQDGRTYVIRNELTHTVLDLTGNATRRLFVMGWEFHGHDNQKWTAIRVHHDSWKLRNHHIYDDQPRFLSPQLEDEQPNRNYRLVGGILSCEFVIQEIGATGTYRILYDNRAVSLVTGGDIHKIEARDVLFDLHANGPPIALQPSAENSAQIWHFHDMIANFPTTGILDPLTNDGTYKIVNSKTGTVLDIVKYRDDQLPVHALASKGGDHHRWIVSLGLGSRTKYSFKSSAENHTFLAPETADPGNGTALIGGGEKLFLVRKVPDTQLYKIFWADSQELAVNIVVVDGEPDSANGAVVSLQAAEAQTWYFVKC